MTNLYYIIYSSTPARPLISAELECLLVTARAENKRFDITGMLICLPDSYIQLIEGPRATLEQLYTNIQKDSRHYRVNTIKEGPIARRFFPDWAMAFDTAETALTDSDASFDITTQRVFELFDILDKG